jgi:hypothetical protein
LLPMLKYQGYQETPYIFLFLLSSYLNRYFARCKGLLFEFEHLFLDGYSAGGGEAAETAVGPQDTVTGDNERDRIARHDAADRPGGARPAHLPGQLNVSLCTAKSYLAAGLQDSLPERPGAVEAHRRLGAEIHQLALIVGDDPRLEASLEIFGRSQAGADVPEAPEQPLLGLPMLADRQKRPAHGVLRAHQAEIAPFGSENSVVQHGIPRSWPSKNFTPTL